jgi:hypothetical protein
MPARREDRPFWSGSSSLDADMRQVYWVWSAMRKRCQEPSDPAYVNYGGRGISICERWLSFENFIADMGPRPEGGMIDRIDNSGNYEPDNCKWSTRKEQNSNRRNCIYVELDGIRMTLKEACRVRGVKYRPVHKRIMDRGWDVMRALSEPIREQKGASC